MNLISLEPITSVTPLEFYIYFSFYYILALLVRLGFYFLSKATNGKFYFYKPKENIVLLVIVSSIFEELIFRGIPYFLTGNPKLVFLGTVVWSIFHRYPSVIASSFIFGILLYRYWIGGLWVYAILSHLILNSLNTLIIITFLREEG